MNYIYSAAALMLVSMSSVMAQAPKIVVGSATVSPAHVARGGHGVLRVTLSVAPGFHIYANPASDPDIIPTVVKGLGPAGIVFGKPQYPAGKAMKFSYSPQPLKVYAGKAVVLLPFTVGEKRKAWLSAADEQCQLPRVQCDVLLYAFCGDV